MRGRNDSNSEELSDKDVDALLNRDWAGEAMGRIDRLVEGVHDRAILPLVTLVRAFVFGIIITLMAFTILVLLVLALVRILNVYATNERIWLTYAILGGFFSLVGLLLWVKRKTKEST